MSKSAFKSAPQININLIPREELAGPLKTVIPWALGAGKVLVILAEVIAISALLFSIKLTADRNSFKNAIQTKAAQIESKAKTENEVRAFQKKLENIRSLRKNQTNMSVVLEELEDKLPVDSVLTELKVEGSSVSLSGSVETTQGLQALITVLRESKKIKNLEISQLTVPTEQSPFYTFTAVATMEGVGKQGT